MPRITISYRRDDSGTITGRIFDRLVTHYGRDAVFRDIDNIPLGVDFREHINSVLDASDVVLAIVGPRWIGPRGQSRLANEADPVRVEIEATLRKGVPLIPVLVLRAMMPRADQLPDAMKDFAYRNAIQVDDAQDFDVHMARLTRAMDRMLEVRTSKPADFVRETPGAISLDRLPAEPEEATPEPEPEPLLSEPASFAPEAATVAPRPTRRGVSVGVLIVAAVLLAGGAGIGIDRFLAAQPGAASRPEAADSRVKALQDDLVATRQQADQDKKRLAADQSTGEAEPLRDKPALSPAQPAPAAPPVIAPPSATIPAVPAQGETQREEPPPVTAVVVPPPNAAAKFDGIWVGPFNCGPIGKLPAVQFEKTAVVKDGRIEIVSSAAAGTPGSWSVAGTVAPDGSIDLSGETVSAGRPGTPPAGRHVMHHFSGRVVGERLTADDLEHANRGCKLTLTRRR